jgi:cell fate (sporulation/competence/biofilm development) regulator YlbF (YheA/YmcA/DUF963 family)
MTTCEISYTSSQAFNADREAELAADKLGSLLFDTPAFQTYLRLSRAVNLDREVKALNDQIRERQMYYLGAETPQTSLDELYARLEALPSMRAFRQAECAVRELFSAVDAAVSAAAQAPFTRYARSGCG